MAVTPHPREMMMELQTTSDMRRSLCALIVRDAYAGDAAVKRSLGEHLAVMPFERMGDQALIDMAWERCDHDRVTSIVETRSPVRYAIEVLVLCAECQDQHHVEGTDGRWHRCANCNPVEHPEPETVGA